MRPIIRTVTLLASLFIATITLLTGCASSAERKARMSSTLLNVEVDYREAQLRTAATEAALNELAVSADLDLRQSFDAYSFSVDRMEEIGKRLLAHADGMHSRGRDYFAAPPQTPGPGAPKQTEKPQEQRSAAPIENFDAIAEAGSEIKRDFRAYQFDIKQIHDTLAGNLSPISIDAIAQFLRKAQVDGDSLQQNLTQALDELQRARSATPPFERMGAPTPPRPQS